MLFHLYGLESADDPSRYCLLERNPDRDYERRLRADDRPMQVQASWADPGQFMFVLRLNSRVESIPSPPSTIGGDGVVTVR